MLHQASWRTGRNRTKFGFMLMIALVVFVGLWSIYTVQTIAEETELLYQHPFTVSNAARDISINTVSMHRYMEDVARAQDDVQLDRAAAQVKVYEQKVLDNFVILFDRFLGDKSEIQAVYENFIAWRDVRDEVIALKHIGNSTAAAEITNGKGADYVQLLTDQIQGLVDFAAAKASEFRTNSQKNARQSVIFTSILASSAVLLGLLVSAFILRRQKSSIEAIQKRDHLIDQNIMIAQLNTAGHVIEISNALCRYLGVLREQITGSPSHFFTTANAAADLEETIWRSLKTGSRWSGEIKRTTVDGAAKWAEITILPILDSAYNIDGYTCILHDLTSKKLSLTDKLTALGNRRQYEQILEREINLAKRNNTLLTLAVIDIDFFKNYNDRYGHPQGDIALTEVSKAILSSMRRPNDYAFRIGGEEFAVLFSGLDKENAWRFLDTIRQAVARLKIPHAASKINDHMTVSIGGATIPGTDLIDGERLYEGADQALYKAKDGRNQTIIT